MSRRQLGLALFAVAVMLLLAPAGPASASYSQVKLDKHDRLDGGKELQVRNVGDFKDSDNLKFQHGENGGTKLEWGGKVGKDDRHIGNSFTCNDVVATPIPTAAWLLGSGFLALIGLKRRNRKKDR
jgi:hypothetical protein